MYKSLSNIRFFLTKNVRSFDISFFKALSLILSKKVTSPASQEKLKILKPKKFPRRT